MKRSSAIEKILEKMQARAVTSTNAAGLNMVAKVRPVLRGIESLEKIASNRFPAETNEAHYLRVNGNAKRLRQEINRVSDDLTSMFGAELESVDIHLNDRFKPSAQAQEIRAVIREMPMKDRPAFIMQAIKKGDTEVIAALRGSHPMLSGLDGDFHGRAVESAEELIAPDLVARREEIIGLFSDAQVALSTAEKALGEWSDPEKLSDIEKKENQAKEAENSLNEALQERSFNVQQDI
ncbi:MAG: hypothetical protein KIT59_09955 [Nitrosomonas sp.]|nr:hypothetical protein [Nitrosomonas sp.]